MTVETLNGLAAHDARPATRVLIRADDGTPVAALVEWAGGILFTHAGEPDFAATLAELGLNLTVRVDRLGGGPRFPGTAAAG
jgi:hypothetical protein